MSDNGYLAVGALLFVEDFGVPTPGETILIAAAVYAGAGQLNIVVVAVAVAAAVAGDNLGYLIGRTGGRAFIHRWGRYILLPPQRFHRAERFFARHGGKVVTVARFVEGLRQANGIIATSSAAPSPSSSTASARRAPAFMIRDGARAALRAWPVDARRDSGAGAVQGAGFVQVRE
ncbi:membrane protein DedA with SNARE-associated domain [Streptosporangium album]|uniref:Membrane protein DedA with SNARE-associated domain n=1 Tax=Streptosporangium album TaxID=47479 RepID=A0A7W7S565_9ACTN|nr:DedA family protein [Streptosporangium album]MBB4944091.1 membrane protein DedA with SNARE-associated domain [Streptosporangium album]